MFSARNEYEAFQLLMLPGKATAIKVESGALVGENGKNTISADNITIYHVKCLKKDMPDPLFPVFGNIDLPPGEITSLWISIHTPSETPAGKYSGKIRIAVHKSGETIEIPFILKVWNFILPEKPSLKTAYGIEPNLIRPSSYQNIEKYVDCLMKYRLSPYFKIATEFNNQLLHSLATGKEPKRQPSNTMRDGVIVPKYNLNADGKIKVDFSQYDFFMKKLINKNMNTLFTMPRVWDAVYSSVYAWKFRKGRSIHQCNYYLWVFDKKKNKFRWYGFSILSEKYRQVMSSIMKQWQAHLDEKGWTSMCYNYLVDEPAYWLENVSKTSSEIYGIAKQASPSIKTFITSAAEDIKNIDVRCVELSHYGHCPLPKLRRMQKQGTKFWFYTSNATMDYAPNMYAYSKGIYHRILPWRNWKYNGTGELYWHINYWTDLRLVKKILDGKVDPDKMDGRLVYPLSSDKLLTSIRLEILRDGMEDYEYLVLLAKTLKTGRLSADEIASAQKILSVPIVKGPENIILNEESLLKLRKQAGEILNRVYSK